MQITSTMEYNGQKFILTWIRDNDLNKYTPATQVYGIVFNDSGEILISRAKEEDKWQISGGTPEPGETLTESLIRELKEEVDITIKQITPLGVQRVEVEENHKRKLSSYQLRYIALLDQLLPQTPDPDPKVNTIWQRKFVPALKIKDYIKWGDIGNAMFEDAIELFKQIKNK